jgi:predicted DNA-binding transcriptional regulator AlpA
VQQLLDIEALAERWAVPKGVIYGMRYRGEAPRAIKVGRELRFDLRDVEAWEAERRDNGGPERG